MQDRPFCSKKRRPHAARTSFDPLESKTTDASRGFRTVRRTLTGRHGGIETSGQSAND
jgi:hypothetical protein